MTATATRTRPRLAFVGVGWIGRSRLEALARSGVAEVASVTDLSPDAAADAAAAVGAEPLQTLEDALAGEPDGIVVATPNALHAEQCLAALERGVAVFCQKPLGRNADETRAVVEAARAAGRPLGVDLSYRHVEAARAVRDAVRALGPVHAAELVFHNAYGPDKPWFRDPALAGGGCLLDLGIHLLDLALWTLGDSEARVRFAHVHGDPVERYAAAELDVAGTAVRVACSWNLPLGRDAAIEAAFYGDRAGARFTNVGGSFYDFRAERMDGTAATVLAEPPDDWGGRAVVAWAERLARGEGFDEADGARLVRVAELIDEIYRRGRG